MENSSSLWSILSPDSAFWTDAGLILDLPEAELRAALGRINEDHRFIGNGLLSKHLEGSISDPAHRQALANFLRNIPRLRNPDQDPEQFAEWFIGALREFPFSSLRESKLPDDKLSSLGSRLKLILEEPLEGLAKQRKAESLVHRTGSKLLDVELISDLRPIFDEDASGVEALIPITTLRISYLLNDERHSSEVQLTEDQLSDMLGKVDRAKKKIAVLKAMLASHEIVVPESEMTSAMETEE